MYKIVTVDDEHMVKRGLRKIIESLRPEFTIVGEASDGQEALELVTRHRPQLVITDICMPIMDGIELIREIRSREYPVKFIVLSGYSDFTYAQQAVHYDVTDYLLKPMKPESVQQALESAYHHYQNTQQVNDWRSDCLWRCTELAEELVQQLWRLNDHKIPHIAEEIYKQITDNELVEHDRKQLVLDVLTFIEKKLTQKGMQYEKQELISIITQTANSMEMKQVFRSLLDVWTTGIKNGRNLGQQKNIKRALDFIQLHIADNELSLCGVAEQTSISPAYLSKLFKEEVGHNFISYVTNLRIEKAKAFLSDPVVKTYEVCHSVGYADYPHFAKTFKKVTGLSPTEYRNSLQT